MSIRRIDVKEICSYQNETEYYSDILALVKNKLKQYKSLIDLSLSVPETIQEKNGRKVSRLFRNGFLKGEVEIYEEIQKEFKRQTNIIKKRTFVTIQEGEIIPLEYLLQIFDADDFLRHCVYMAFAPEIEYELREGLAELVKNSSLYPTIEFCMNVYTLEIKKRIELKKEVFQNEQKWNYFFGDILSDRRNPWDKELFLEERILRFIFQFEADNKRLKPFCHLCFPSDPSEFTMVFHKEILERMLEYDKKNLKNVIYYLNGPSGVGKKYFVNQFFKSKDQVYFLVNIEGLLPEEGQKNLKELLRELKIRRAGLCIWNLEKILKEQNELEINRLLLSILEAIPSFFILGTLKWPYDKEKYQISFVEIPLEMPKKCERELLWSEMLKETSLDLDKIITDQLASRFCFTPGQIRNSIKSAGNEMFWKNKGMLTEEMLYEACHRQIEVHLEKQVMRIEMKYQWEDLILKDACKRMLQDACNQIEYHYQVYETWGFDKIMAYGRGVSMLFYGPPGTGKTMGAQVMANYLHLELYKVDISAIMSKYIGETEKNLSTIFNEVKNSQSILFFDEADSLFGKRSEVKDSNDKYANAETSYLLQKMEEYEGIVILATNYIQNFDEAFKRRIKFMIEFPFPEKEQRLTIWKKAYPEETPIGSDVDFTFLAEHFELSGSNIKNIALASAFKAAADESIVTMKYMINSVYEEIKKTGKILQEDDFGEYFYLVSR